MKIKVIVIIFVALIIGSAILPGAMDSLGSAATTSGPITQTDVVPTVLPTLTVIPITPMRNLPVIDDSQSITVNLTPIAETTDYTFNNTTGVATVNADVIASGDTVRTTYSWTTSGTIAAMYGLLGLFAILGVAFMFWRQYQRGKV